MVFISDEAYLKVENIKGKFSWLPHGMLDANAK